MTENKRLGKGLSSLLGEKRISFLSNINTQTENEGVREISLELITRNENQPRKYFNKEALEELATSIKEFGILQPIVVRKSSIYDTKYEIISGERRFRASKIAGLMKIPAIIKDFDDETTFSLSVIENIQRQDLNVVEEAMAYREFMDIYGFTQQKISDKIGKSRSHVANLLRLLTLPEKILKYLSEEKIDFTNARALIGFEEAEKYIDYIVENSLTVKEINKIVKGEVIIDLEEYEKQKNNVSQETIPQENVSRETISETKQIKELLKAKQKSFQERFGFACKIIFNENKKSGSLTLKYKNLEDLDNLLNKIK